MFQLLSNLSSGDGLINAMLLVFMLAISAVLAGSLHEYVHAYTALKLGDDTAKLSGRLTLDPRKHIELFGILFLLLFGFGWTRPIPINERNFEKPVLYTALVSLVGPLFNLLLAIIFGFTLAFAIEPIYAAITSPFLSQFFDYTKSFIETFVLANVIYAVFNILPIPPLDGFRIVRVFLPTEVRLSWDELEQYSLFIFLFVFFIPPFSNYIGVAIGTLLNIVLELVTFGAV